MIDGFFKMKKYLNVVVHGKITHGLCVWVPVFAVILERFRKILSMFVKSFIKFCYFKMMFVMMLQFVCLCHLCSPPCHSSCL